MALVWSRAICTVLFLMAELCRRRVPCVRAVGVPSRSKQGCTDVRVWLPKLGGLNIFVRTFLRGYLWASPFFVCLFFFIIFFIFLFFFVDVGNRTNVFFVQEHILAKFGALRARSFNLRDRSLHGIDIVICMGVLACACERG